MAEDRNHKIIKFDELGSTSAKAKELAGQGAESWTVVVAKKQGQGYGRKGNEWYSPEGGLYFSVILPKGNIDDLQILTILAAFCVAKAIKDDYRVEPFVKLPNDVYLNGKKVCGILTENVISGEVKSSVIGIGVNTNIDEFPEDLANAASLKIELGKTIDNSLILGQIISQLQATFKSISR
jgi:BirA family transcriptional regulator, biotin operon repressor / biotin---[acetyl-CoA-carboxylase] ligase